ncbi:MAG: FAD-dependent monooxygenase [Chitinophagales bacterium]|nr:FAD-dependent monooxygenase [Chitinophagales bacterium]
MKSATIVGAGLVGSLWSVYLAKAGYKVNIVEMRSDLREADISAGKSINLAFSERGWTAFKTVGIEKEIEDIALPMYGRTMHDLAGNLTYQPYGQEGQAIYSVSRAEINCRMMDVAEKYGDATIHFNEKCIGADLENGIVYCQNTQTGKRSEFKSDVVFAADGAFSAVRYRAMQKLDRFQYSQHYIEDGYREILLPANEDGSYKLSKTSLHIWPRGRFMLIALPNEDGSFTCTLFMPFENHEYAFDKLKSKAHVEDFFKKIFPDFYELMPEIGTVWESHPLSSLAIVRCYPWAHGKTVLMGDAAHATVPFYGQGMNSGFEDCSVLWILMQQYDEDWPAVFEQYQRMRKPEGNAVQDLSLDNYYVMRDYVADPKFLLQKKFERRIQQLYPEKYIPLYSQVSFTNTPYSVAYENGKKQDVLIKKIMTEYDIEALFSEDKIDRLIHDLLEKEVL